VNHNGYLKNVLVLGAGGFIGGHLTEHLEQMNCFVRGVDLKYPEFRPTSANEFIIGDLRDALFVRRVIESGFDEIYQLAADMGGAGYIFTGENDADVMHNSSMINLNVVEASARACIPKIFYSSSACVYAEFNQQDPDNPNCEESSAYPAQPDSEYGWEKLFSERLYLAFQHNYGLDVKIARFHNIFGPFSTWEGGKEKAPAAICRKVARAEDGSSIEIWGTGEQTRSFLYIDECIEGITRLMNSGETGPFNIGSEEMVTINELAQKIIAISGKTLAIDHVEGPLGVMGRNSDNQLIQEKLGWAPSGSLIEGLTTTYRWIQEQVQEREKIQV
jgi:nucleoside-diphosphate-sugar epimerase